MSLFGALFPCAKPYDAVTIFFGRGGPDPASRLSNSLVLLLKPLLERFHLVLLDQSFYAGFSLRQVSFQVGNKLGTTDFDASLDFSYFGLGSC